MKKLRGKQHRNPDKLYELSDKALQQLYDQLEIVFERKYCVDQSFDCWESNLPVQDKDGSYKPLRTIFVPGSKTGYQPASVVLAYHGKFPEPGDWVSHLCDNPKCLRPHHLTWENVAKNHRRKNCPGLVQCRCCDKWHDACAHTPPCKKITIKNLP